MFVSCLMLNDFIIESKIFNNYVTNCLCLAFPHSYSCLVTVYSAEQLVGENVLIMTDFLLVFF